MQRKPPRQCSSHGDEPKVIACGHMHVRSAKSGLTFPAFLVKIPIECRPDEDGRRTYTFRWRAKLDFLLLNRALQKAAGALRKKPRRSFPKSAYAKLCQSATPSLTLDGPRTGFPRGPWIRPPEINAGDFYCGNDDYEQIVRSCLVLISSGEVVDGTVVENGYTPEMKKSLHQLDQFLRDAHGAYVEAFAGLQVSQETMEDPEDKGSSCGDQCDVNGSECVASCARVGEETVTLRDLIEAWRMFCREDNTENLVMAPPTFLTGNVFASSSERGGAHESSDVCEQSASSEGERPSKNIDDGNGYCDINRKTTNAARLGQYFASDENAARLVDRTLDLLAASSLFNCVQSGATRTNRKECNLPSCAAKHVVFVEPSCGDGRLLHRLLCSLDEMATHDRYGWLRLFCPWVIGYDIDPSAVSLCQDRLSSFGNRAVVKCRNFLTVTREDILMDLKEGECGYDFDDLFPEEKDKKCSPSIDIARTDGTVSFVFFGGPPYTTGVGSGSTIGRSLPEQFVLHCARDLRAELVVFMLPERCEKEAKSIEEQLNPSEMWRTPDIHSRRWCCTSEHLESSRFDFRGKFVVQPSLLQSWFHGKIGGRHSECKPFEAGKEHANLTLS